MENLDKLSSVELPVPPLVEQADHPVHGPDQPAQLPISVILHSGGLQHCPSGFPPPSDGLILFV